MDVIADIAALIFFGFLLSEAITEGLISWRIGEAADGLLRFPLYPARWILIAGTVLLILQLGLHLIQDLSRIASGEDLEPSGEDSAMPTIAGLGDKQ